jgi:hypothetical protein
LLELQIDFTGSLSDRSVELRLDLFGPFEQDWAVRGGSKDPQHDRKRGSQKHQPFDPGSLSNHDGGLFVLVGQKLL